ncbi:unnamed protein product [Tuber melanosporum]|uniref:(Perigord truffle) hypothetical protein n=1 Tax=Tuber melanosporum (strain Mel28) TaxID=656061 RepID=D5G5G4_TUBMM|nr:uncharacterized protein GSTUM_00004323001 [Tuber melanosporum]CAZ79757.1 unnamed protein product [Tuber melanosporum]
MPQRPYPPLPENPILIPSPSDTIFAGDSSDEESPAAQRAKNQRILGHAQSYLSGQQLYIHSARLRGPVINNPWGKGAKQTKRKPMARMEEKHKTKKRKALCQDDEREILGTPTQVPEWAAWSTERRRVNRRTITESSPDVEELLRPACLDLGESIVSRPTMNRDEVQGREMQTAVVFSNDVTPVATPVNRKEKHKQKLPTPPVFSPGSFYKKLGTKPTPKAAPNPALKPAPKNKTKPTKRVSRSVSHSPVCSNRGRAPAQSRTPSTAISRSKSKPGELDESIHLVAPEANRAMPPLAPADAKMKRIRINFATMSPFTNQPTGTRVEARKTPKKRRKKADDSGINKDPEDHSLKSMARDRATKEPSIVETERQTAREHDVGFGVNKNVIENRQFDRNGNGTRSGAQDKNVEIVTSGSPPIENFGSHTSEPLSSDGSISLQPAQRTALFISLSPIMTASGERSTDDSHLKVTPAAKLLTGKTIPPGRVSSAHRIGGQKANPKPIEKPPTQDTTARPSAVTNELPQSHGQSYFSAPEVGRTGDEMADEEDPEPCQGTQTQLMAAKKGFFDALNDSPFFPQSKLSTTAEETPSVLRPDSFLDLGACKTPTLSFGGSWRNRGKVTDTDSSSSFKTPVPRSNWRPSGDIQVPGTNSPPPPPTSTEFPQTINTPKPSTPEGTTFTPFAAFATPNATPEPTQKDISPLTFSPLRDVTQHPSRQESGTKPYVKFVGFGLLDEDEDAASLDLGPNNFPKSGQKAPDEKEDLVKEVMGFMGQQVWDIDEELKKMARGSQSTKNTDAGKKRRGLRR